MNAEQAIPERRVKKRYSAEDRKRLIKEQQASGKTRQVFCEERGLNVTTFHGWIKNAKKKKQKFAKVKVLARKTAPIEIELPDRKRIGIYINGKQEGLIHLFRGVLGC